MMLRVVRYFLIPFKLTEPIDVSDLQPSMYIYNVKDGSEVKQSGKVLIE